MDHNGPRQLAQQSTAQRRPLLHTPTTSRHSIASSVDRSSSIFATSTTPLVQSTATQNSIDHESNQTNGSVASPPSSSLQVSPPPSIQVHSSISPSPAIPQAVNSPLSATITVRRGHDWHEWRSWKIKWPYLTLLLISTLLLVITIATLSGVSRRDSGFARESRAPGFLVHHPKLKKAIWEQGILYTALPAFVMTIYRSMWDASIMAFADRQPYVDLKKKGGGHPRCTILLDYKAEPVLYRWTKALKNGHYLLSGCLLSSLILSFVIVPLTSFLFTMDTALLNSTVSFTFNTEYDLSSVGKNPFLDPVPDIRLALDSAAAQRLHNSSLPIWTDGSHAFPEFSTDVETGDILFSVETTAVGADADCRIIPESDYTRVIRQLPGTEGYLIDVYTIDRGCGISHSLGVRTGAWSPKIFLTSWHTLSCSMKAGLSRIGLLAARYDNGSQAVQNISLISCQISYFTTYGALTARLDADSLDPSSIDFIENRAYRVGQWESASLRHWFEMYMNQLQCNDFNAEVSGNEFVKYVYRLASLLGPTEHLRSDALANATSILLQTTYAMFAATNLYRPRETPLNGTGTYMVEEKRLFMVEPVSYIILSVLATIALLNISLYFYARHKSILKEEPYGLLNAAGILYQSDVNRVILENVVRVAGDPGRARATAEKLYHLERVNCFWHEAEGKITVDQLPLQIKRIGSSNGSSTTGSSGGILPAGNTGGSQPAATA